jgi:hypothetical protein
MDRPQHGERVFAPIESLLHDHKHHTVVTECTPHGAVQRQHVHGDRLKDAHHSGSAQDGGLPHRSQTAQPETIDTYGRRHLERRKDARIAIELHQASSMSRSGAEAAK